MKFLQAILIAMISCIGIAQLDAYQTVDAENPVVDLWDHGPLPKGVIAKYGSTDRHSSDAVGVFDLRYSNDGKLLAIKADRANMRILNVEERELVAMLPYTKPSDFKFTPDDQSIVIGERKSFAIWDIESQKEIQKIDQPAYKLAFNHAGDEFTSMGIGKAFRSRWPLKGEPKRFDSSLTRGTILPAGLSPDGRFALFHNGRQSELFDTTVGSPVEGTGKIIYRQSAFSNDSTQFVAFNQGLQAMVYYDLRNLADYQARLPDERRTTAVAFSNDGRFLFSGNYSSQIVLWDLLTMQEIGRFVGHNARVHTIAVEPNGFLKLASGSAGMPDRSVVFWDLRPIVFPDVEVVEDLDWDRLWRDLGSPEQLKSLNATRLLSQALRQNETVYADLESKLGLVNVVGDVDELLKRLDDPEFSVREDATKRLGMISRDILPQLESHLKNGSQEAKWRIKKMLDAKFGQRSSSSPEGRRNARIVLALELRSDENAVEQLQQIADLSSDENMVADAKAAIERISNAAQ